MFDATVSYAAKHAASGASLYTEVKYLNAGLCISRIATVDHLEEICRSRGGLRFPLPMYRMVMG
jgi:hypothetical protein